MHDPQSLQKYLYVHGDPVANTDPFGHAIEPYDVDPDPASASLKGIWAHKVFTEYVAENLGILNAGLTLSTLLPEHVPAGAPGATLKPDAVYRPASSYF